MNTRGDNVLSSIYVTIFMVLVTLPIYIILNVFIKFALIFLAPFRWAAKSIEQFNDKLVLKCF